MSTPVHDPQMDRALEQYWGLHLTAQSAADVAEKSWLKADAEARAATVAAENLRQQINDLVAQLHLHEATAATKGGEALKQQDEHGQNAALAALHFSTVERLMSGTALEHPRERFQQAAESFDADPLNQPLPPPMVPAGQNVGDTQTFAAQPEPVS